MKNQVKIIDLRREQASSLSVHEFDWLGGAVSVIAMTCFVVGIVAFSHGDWIFLLILIAGMVVCGLFISCLQAFRSDAKGDSRDLVDNPANRANRMQYGEARYQYLSSQESFYLRAGAQAGSGIGSLLALVSGTSIPFHLARAGASALRKKAQQHEAVSGTSLETKDPRLPVLYLRSFDDEKWLSDHSGQWNLEQIVVETGSLLGPVVAIGRPGEGLPPLGAARDYVSDDEWQQHAHNWMKKASAVFLVIGPTEGLGWEVSRLNESNLLDKTILVIPPSDKEEISNRWAVLLAHLSKTAPDFAQRLQQCDPLQCNAIIFTNTGNPVMLHTGSRDVRSYETSLTYALGETQRTGEEEFQPTCNSNPLATLFKKPITICILIALGIAFWSFVAFNEYRSWQDHKNQELKRQELAQWEPELREIITATAYEHYAKLGVESLKKVAQLQAQIDAYRKNPEEAQRKNREMKEWFNSLSLEEQRSPTYAKILDAHPTLTELQSHLDKANQLPETLVEKPYDSDETRGWKDGKSAANTPFLEGYRKGSQKVINGTFYLKNPDAIGMVLVHYKRARTLAEKLYVASEADAYIRGYMQGKCPSFE